jgi:hypothetical protein
VVAVAAAGMEWDARQFADVFEIDVLREDGVEELLDEARDDPIR